MAVKTTGLDLGPVHLYSSHPGETQIISNFTLEIVHFVRLLCNSWFSTTCSSALKQFSPHLKWFHLLIQLMVTCSNKGHSPSSWPISSALCFHWKWIQVCWVTQHALVKKGLWICLSHSGQQQKRPSVSIWLHYIMFPAVTLCNTSTD